MSTIAELELQIKRVWHGSCHTLLHSALEERLRAATRLAVKATLEAALLEELTASLGFEAFARSPHGPKPPTAQRAGFFERQLLSSYGLIPDLRVPKLRAGNADREWHILTRYQRMSPLLLDQLLYLYMLGLSLRDLQEALYVLLGHLLSRSAVNRVTSALQTTMQAWRDQPILETPPILIVDGVWVSILYPTGATRSDRSGHVRAQVRGQERVILAVLAVWPDGRSHLLHYQVATKEDASNWRELWQALRARGLEAEQVRMVVSDGSKGVLETLASELPHSALQRCVVHKVRSFERNLRYHELELIDPETQQPRSQEQAREQRRNAISAEALSIFQAPSQAEAEARLSAFETSWQTREAAAVKTFRQGLKRCFTFYQFDEALHPLVRSTNLLERFFGEFRSRADEMGAFPNETSCLTVFHLVMIRDHAKHDRLNFAQTV